MPASTSRQRVLDALNHRQPDAVPLDLGGTFVTGMHCSVVAALREALGLERRPVKVHEPYQMLGFFEEDLRRAIGADVEGVVPASTIFGYPAEGWKPWRAPWGQDLLVPGQFNTTTSSDGSVYMYPAGDMSVPPSGHMPAGGFFFDAIVRQHPIDDDKLNVADNLEEFGPIDAATLGRITRGVADAASTDRAVLVCTPGTALGDIALVPAPFLRQPKGIRDIEEWYLSLAVRRDYVAAIFERQTQIALANLQTIHRACGDKIDIVVLCGTDFGTQTSTFCSDQTFREMWLPHYRAMNDWIHSHTQWKTFKHSCGAVFGLIDSFIDAGFDILNPVQCSATGMDPAALKARFGDRITFWGGGVDTQRVLPFGSPREVREQVLERLRVFSAGGGFVFNAIHNVQAQTPVANVLAMLNAVHEFNGQGARLASTPA
jgi:hypothetical protein